MLKKTYKYRIYPTKKQGHLLDSILDECRWLYNHFLETRKTSWEKENKSLSAYDQTKTLSSLKKEKESLKIVYSQVLQDVAFRLDGAFKSFFRRVKNHEEPGFPRFKGKGHYDSVTYPQANSFEILKGRIHLARIGDIKIIHHRPANGIPKTCTVKRTKSGKWFVTIVCDVEPKFLRASKKSVGIDLGLSQFATLTDGTRISNPRFFKTDQKALAKEQRRFSKQKKGTPRRRQLGKRICKIHERITNRRHNFCHQETRKIVNAFGTIFVEDLQIQKMLEERRFSKSISDASWGQFVTTLVAKAENAGRQVVKVNPAYTSQDCSGCGARQKMPVEIRRYDCPNCGLSLDRDLNAALNIKAVGTHGLISQGI